MKPQSMSSFPCKMFLCLYFTLFKMFQTQLKFKSQAMIKLWELNHIKTRSSDNKRLNSFSAQFSTRWRTCSILKSVLYIRKKELTWSSIRPKYPHILEGYPFFLRSCCSVVDDVHYTDEMNLFSKCNSATWATWWHGDAVVALLTQLQGLIPSLYYCLCGISHVLPLFSMLGCQVFPNLMVPQMD